MSNKYYARAKSSYNTAKSNYRKTVNFGKRVSENYDIVLFTLGTVVLFAVLGYPITKETITSISSSGKSNNKENKK